MTYHDSGSQTIQPFRKQRTIQAMFPTTVFLRYLKVKVKSITDTNCNCLFILVTNRWDINNKIKNVPFLNKTKNGRQQQTTFLSLDEHLPNMIFNGLDFVKFIRLKFSLK